jgi:hypothetical protein
VGLTSVAVGGAGMDGSTDTTDESSVAGRSDCRIGLRPCSASGGFAAWQRDEGGRLFVAPAQHRQRRS